MNLPRVILIAALAVAFAGCATESRPVAQLKTPPAYPWRQLHPGMNRFHVEFIMGKPQKVQDNPGKEGEIWVYERPIGTRVDPVSSGIVQELWVDPIDNEVKTIPVSMQGLQRTIWTEMVEVEVVDGAVASVERVIVSQRGFSD